MLIKAGKILVVAKIASWDIQHLQNRTPMAFSHVAIYSYKLAKKSVWAFRNVSSTVVEILAAVMSLLTGLAGS